MSHAGLESWTGIFTRCGSETSCRALWLCRSCCHRGSPPGMLYICIYMCVRGSRGICIYIYIYIHIFICISVCIIILLHMYILFICWTLDFKPYPIFSLSLYIYIYPLFPVCNGPWSPALPDISSFDEEGQRLVGRKRYAC